MVNLIKTVFYDKCSTVITGFDKNYSAILMSLENSKQTRYASLKDERLRE